MDRDRDRDRDRRFDEPRRGGESYRPGAGDRSFRRSPRPDIRPRSPRPDMRPRSPRPDIRQRSPRPDLRQRSPPPFRPAADTWAPGRSRPRSRSPDFRRRSRSPPYRGRGRDRGGYGNWPPPRSPPRRLSPGRDRSPPRGPRRSRSPPPRPPPFVRPRSPGLKRGREDSPPGAYYPRSPKRERRISPPRGGYEPLRSPPRYESYRGAAADHPRPRGYVRSRSPERRDGWRESYGGRSWRRRSPTPPPIERSARNSLPGSTSTSRRSSPPVHPDRVNRAGPIGRSPAYRPQYEGPPPPRSPAYSNARFPPRGPAGAAYRPPSPRRPSIVAASPRLREPSPPRSYVGSERSEILRPELPGKQIASPAQPAISPKDVQSSPRLPPTQPRDFGKTISPPSGPSAASKPTFQPLRVSGNAALLSAPTRPKGGPGPPPFHRESSRDTPRHPSGRRGTFAPSPHHGPPSGPRGSTSGYDSHRPPPFRGNTTSTTYPQSKRFTNHLSNLPTIVPGGKLLPSGLDSSSEKRLAQLEADKEKLLDQIAEKQRVKRSGLAEWDKLSRETATSALRSDLAEGALQQITEGDGIGGGSTF